MQILILPPGVGSCVPAPSRENTSLFSSRDTMRRNVSGVLLPISSSLCWLNVEKSKLVSDVVYWVKFLSNGQAKLKKLFLNYITCKCITKKTIQLIDTI